MLDYDHFIGVGGGLVWVIAVGVEICLRWLLGPRHLASYRGLHFLPWHAHRDGFSHLTIILLLLPYSADFAQARNHGTFCTSALQSQSENNSNALCQ